MTRSAATIRRQVRILRRQLEQPQWPHAGSYMLGQVQALEWVLGTSARPDQMAEFAVVTARQEARRRRVGTRTRP